MYRLKEKQSECVIINESEDLLYIERQSSLWAVSKKDLTQQLLADNLKDCHTVYTLGGNPVLHCDGALTAILADGTQKVMGEGWFPNAQIGEDLLVTDRSVRPNQLLRLNAAGQEVWRQHIALGVQHIVQDDSLYYIKKDGPRVRPNVINRLSLATGEHRELIDLDPRYLSEVPDKDRYDHAFYQLMMASDKEVIAVVNGNKVIAVDVHTGDVTLELTHFTNRNGNLLPVDLSGPVDGGTYNGRRYILLGNMFASFDASSESLTMLQHPLKDTAGSGVYVYSCHLAKDRFHIKARMTEGSQHAINCIGIFDIAQEAATWITEVPMAPGATLRTAPYGNDQYLFVADSNNVLYIYERN
ncbi:hypothetical protein HGH92_27115 [Chitinophaga varians]|uniref:Uncharacterized protein n=1 Tax=Chitinophaga varians TaxID=2202339 RepID=A0A847RYZ8_9BACT|nr:hypothetical protein [Chitinophaga varians]NLR68006.1 hypothetical protein [Chitinophaga varians]